MFFILVFSFKCLWLLSYHEKSQNKYVKQGDSFNEVIGDFKTTLQVYESTF